MRQHHVQHNHAAAIVTVWLDGHSLTIPYWFIGDGYTGVPDPKDRLPARVHDWAYREQAWDDGTPISREEADMLLYMLMMGSTDKDTKRLASLYYVGVRALGWMFWHGDRWRPTPKIA